MSNLDLGTVSIAKGAAKRLSDYIGFATDAQTGSMTDGSNSINSSINDIDAEILRTQAHVQTYSDDLRLKFQQTLAINHVAQHGVPGGALLQSSTQVDRGAGLQS